jgi:hypothetical protein
LLLCPQNPAKGLGLLHDQGSTAARTFLGGLANRLDDRLYKYRIRKAHMNHIYFELRMVLVQQQQQQQDHQVPTNRKPKQSSYAAIHQATAASVFLQASNLTLIVRARHRSFSIFFLNSS